MPAVMDDCVPDGASTNVAVKDFFLSHKKLGSLPRWRDQKGR